MKLHRNKISRKERGSATQIVSRPYLIAQATNEQTKPYTFKEKPEVFASKNFFMGNYMKSTLYNVGLDGKGVVT